VPDEAGVVYAYLTSPIGYVWIAATPVGICAIQLADETPDQLFAGLRKRIGSAPPREDPAALAPALAQLREYFCRTRRRFDLPLDARGTPFQKTVWAEVSRIPYGATATYSDVARRIGQPQAVRAVGSANGANPLPIIVPCHRVIGRRGALTGYGAGLEIKAALLELEGAL
jgi:methylated-DNA-[protein]-cysteine S-methyltransferase